MESPSDASTLILSSHGRHNIKGPAIPSLAILKSIRVSRASPLFDSLLDLSSRIDPSDDGYEMDLIERVYELEVGGRMRSHSDNSLSKLNKKRNAASTIMAILSFTNSILGAGLIGLPYAMMRSGLIIGLILLVMVTLIVDWSILLLIRTGRLVCASSYQDLMRKAFGPWGSIICGLFQVIFSLGGMCVYLIILADNVTRVGGYYLPESIFTERAFVILITTILVVIPLSFSKRVDHLENFSLLALVSMLLIMISIVIESPVAMITPGPISLVRWGFIDALGIVSFTFVCHHDSFDVHDSLEIPSVSSFSTVTHYSTGISLFASMLLSIPAYLCFGDDTEANILNNFGTASFIINLSRILLAASLILTFPLDCFIARNVLSTILFGKNPPEWSHYVITSSLISLTMAVTLGYTNLEMVLELTGGLAASALAFIFPSACYLRLAPIDQYSGSTRLLAKILLIFGIFVLVSNSTSTIYGAMSL